MRCIAVALLCVCGIGLGAQAPAQVQSAEAQIAAAEKAAASLPSVTANAPPRKCNIVKPEQIVFPGSQIPASFNLASGDFVAKSISFGWDEKYEIGKMPLTPRHLDPSTKVRLDLSRLDPPGETRTESFQMVNVTGGGQMFYATATTFPTPGRWMVIATAGANWGCYVFDRPVKATPTTDRH